MRNHWLQRSWPLEFAKIESHPGYFLDGPMVVIQKGPYTVHFYPSHMQDLKDVNGLDATYEMTVILVQELEYRPGERVQPWNAPAFKPRIQLTFPERRKIYDVLAAYRRGEDPLAVV